MAESTSFCSRCGVAIQDDANFCRACGARVQKLSVTPSQSPGREVPPPPLQVQSAPSVRAERSYLRDRRKVKAKEKARFWWFLALSVGIACVLSVALSTSVSWKFVFGVVALVDLVWIVFFRKRDHAFCTVQPSSSPWKVLTMRCNQRTFTKSARVRSSRR